MDLLGPLAGPKKISNLALISSSIKNHDCFQSLHINTSYSLVEIFKKNFTSSFIPCQLTAIWNNPEICIEKKILHLFLSFMRKRFKKNVENTVETLFQLISKYLIRNSKFTEYNQIHHTTESRNTYMGNRISKIQYLQIVIKMYVN